MAPEPLAVRNNPVVVCVFVCLGVAESVRNTPSTDTMPAASAVPSSELPEPEGPFLPSEEEPQGPPTAHVRPSHPLKSFAVPAVPPTGGPFDPALPSTPLLTQQGEGVPRPGNGDFKGREELGIKGNMAEAGVSFVGVIFCA